MKKFLEEVARVFAEVDGLREFCFVFPNRRSSIFFRRYLGLAAGKSLFSPRLVTIDELFQDLSGLMPADRIELLKVLYDCYVEVVPQKEEAERETFDRFIFWGDIILRDFDDIDKYLVQADKLLVNIKELKEISTDYDFLSPTQKEAIAQFCGGFNPENISQQPTDKKRMFLRMWDILLPLYQRFHSALQDRGIAYPGMIYRSVAENCDLTHLKARHPQVVFVGLNALNECEKILLDKICKEGFGDFYWDFYGEMVCNKTNRASHFISENVRRYPSKHSLEGVDTAPEQHFEVIAVPSSVGQTRKASQILADLQSRGLMEDPVETALVLPDESLLFPMLGAVPETIGKINVTMGYPLVASDVAGFFTIVEHLQQNVRIKGGKPHFYHSDVTDILDHPYFAAVSEPATVRRVREEIASANRIFVPQDYLAGQGDAFSIIFRRIPSAEGIAGYLISVIWCVQAGQNGVEKEFLSRYCEAVQKLSSIELDYLQMAPSTWYKLLSQYVSLLSIPYRGEPLDGLQIMGPLETRALDFKNIIMLSVGEGVFPKKSVSASFIPYNLRIGFGLPTYELQDSIGAYYFYRSIFRAENIYLLYDSRTEGLQNGEVSRYVKQLRYHFKVPMEEKVVSYSLSGAMPQESSSVEKGPEVMKLIMEKFVTGEKTSPFSATSLNCYLDCKLKYYYEYILGLGQDNSVSEELEANTFGSVFHKVMENIYAPMVDRIVEKKDIAAIKKDAAFLEKLVDNALLSEAKITEIEGNNLILKSIIIKYVEKVLETDMELCPFEMKGAEHKVGVEWPVATIGRSVRFYSKIDRTDFVGGRLRVVDYKTGTAKGYSECKDVGRLFDFAGDKRQHIAFQLYFYALMMQMKDGGRYVPCIYSVRDLFGDKPIEGIISDENMEDFRRMLGALVEEIFDPGVPFSANADNDNVCKYCNFRKVCKKQ